MSDKVEERLLIDFKMVRDVLQDIGELVDDLDGIDLDESDAITSQSKGRHRQERARISQDLNLLADRLDLAAQLVRVQYWKARGEEDPLSHPPIGGTA